MAITENFLNECIDVTQWNEDFNATKGARSKTELLSPSQVKKGIKPNWRYLFKFSDRRYPEQFWGEIIAYRIGCILEIDVPPAFVAKRFNKESEEWECGALIEWFYDSNTEQFIEAGGEIKRLFADYDLDKGKQHSLVYNTQVVCRLLKIDFDLYLTWLNHWLFFDAIIGNTDRHHDNWGVMRARSVMSWRLAPLFDNGTAFGCEQFLNKPATRDDHEGNKALLRYIYKGRHHIRRTPKCAKPLKHIGASILPSANRLVFKTKLHKLMQKLANLVDEVQQIDAPTPLTPERANWIKRVTLARITAIEEHIMIEPIRATNLIQEPERLFITWQPLEGGTRYLLGSIVNCPGNSEYRVNPDEAEIQEIKDKGFSADPNNFFRSGIDPINWFRDRLPPKKREDFQRWLVKLGLPNEEWTQSDACLLAYTGAKKTGDCFGIVPDLTTMALPFEYIAEVCGTRYEENLNLEQIEVGRDVALVPDDLNQYDNQAIAVMSDNARLGFINRVLCHGLRELMQKTTVKAVVSRKNGTPDRPLVYIKLTIGK